MRKDELDDIISPIAVWSSIKVIIFERIIRCSTLGVGLYIFEMVPRVLKP